mmetsp:Transcript_2040/g.5651  ORF Transcript_2040/g.5651 Transcript_2040/m.5651 type:complete len:208 (+) Transcript_2040:854-1477(+)
MSASQEWSHTSVIVNVVFTCWLILVCLDRHLVVRHQSWGKVKRVVIDAMWCAEWTPFAERLCDDRSVVTAKSLEEGMMLVTSGDWAWEWMVATNAPVSCPDHPGVLNPFSARVVVDGRFEREHGSPSLAASFEYFVDGGRHTLRDPAAVQREVDDLLMILVSLAPLHGRDWNVDIVLEVDLSAALASWCMVVIRRLAKALGIGVHEF